MFVEKAGTMGLCRIAVGTLMSIAAEQEPRVEIADRLWEAAGSVAEAELSLVVRRPRSRWARWQHSGGTRDAPFDDDGAPGPGREASGFVLRWILRADPSGDVGAAARPIAPRSPSSGGHVSARSRIR